MLGRLSSQGRYLGVEGYTWSSGHYSGGVCHHRARECQRSSLERSDARTGEELWSFPAPAGVIGIPTFFEVDGEQYVAVTAGWGLDAQGVQNGIDKIRGTKTVVPKAGTLLVFKLRKG